MNFKILSQTFRITDIDISDLSFKQTDPLTNLISPTDTYNTIPPRKKVSEDTFLKSQNPDNKKIDGGTWDTHPQFRSSNTASLPVSHYEIWDLYTQSLPENLRPFVKLGILDDHECPKIDGIKVGRYAPQDRNTEIKLQKELKNKRIQSCKSVVVVNSGGAHSLAMARALANFGFLIVVHFNHQNLSKTYHNNMAALYYFAKEISELNEKTLQKNPNASWALILDAHQKHDLEPCVLDEDLPPIPNGFSIIEITEGKTPLQPAQKKWNSQNDSLRFSNHSIQIAYSRGLPRDKLFTIGIHPYSR